MGNKIQRQWMRNRLFFIARNMLKKQSKTVLPNISRKITGFIDNLPEEAILIIDEVDKSGDNQLFLHFIGMLRNKYQKRNEGRDKTSKSVILAGVYDIKTLKQFILVMNSS